MLNMKSGDIIVYKPKDGVGTTITDRRILLLSDIREVYSGAYYKANVFWLNEYWFKEEEVVFTEPENWTKIC